MATTSHGNPSTWYGGPRSSRGRASSGSGDASLLPVGRRLSYDGSTVGSDRQPFAASVPSSIAYNSRRSYTTSPSPPLSVDAVSAVAQHHHQHQHHRRPTASASASASLSGVVVVGSADAMEHSMSSGSLLELHHMPTTSTQRSSPSPFSVAAPITALGAAAHTQATTTTTSASPRPSNPTTTVAAEVEGDDPDRAQQQQHHHGANNISALSWGLTPSIHAKEVDEMSQRIRFEYNEKLRRCTDGMADTLADLLPQDLLFQQLLKDESTRRYCKVRLAEVVETFLYAEQTQHGHQLTLRVAQLEADQHHRREEVKRMEQLLAEEKKMRAEAEARASRHQQQQHDDDDDVVDGTSSTRNPMSDEAARRELLQLLEEATMDGELERARSIMAAPQRVLSLTHTAPRYAEATAFVADLVEALFVSSIDLLRYADGSLESLEALRAGLQVAHSPPRATTDNNNNVHAHMVDTPVPTTQLSSTPLRSQLTSSSTPNRQRLNVIAQERGRLEDVRRRVEAAQDQVRGLMMDLQRTHAAHKTTMEEMQGRVEQLRQEHRRRLGEEDATSQRQRDDLHEQLAERDREVRELRGDLRGVLERAERAELANAELRTEVQSAEANVTTLRDELNTARRSLKQRDAQLHTCSTEQSSLTTMLQEMHVARVVDSVERHMCLLDALYQQRLNHKREMLQSMVYEPMMQQWMEARNIAMDELHQKGAAAQRSESAALEADLKHASLARRLSSLLKSMQSWQRRQLRHARTQQQQHVGVGDDEVEVSSSLSSVEVEEVHDAATTRKSALSAEACVAEMHTCFDFSVEHHHHVRRVLRSAQQTLKEVRLDQSRLGALVEELRTHNTTLQHELDAEMEKRKKCEATQHTTSLLLDDEQQQQEHQHRHERVQLQTALSAVSGERDELQHRWSELNDNYIALEKRIGVLHDRCTSKEHIIAQLRASLAAAQSSTTTTTTMDAVDH